jgi:hypothetical protein
MCKVSDKLKLCAFATPLESLKDYWILSRFNKDLDVEVIGTAVMPYYMTTRQTNSILTSFLNLLNDGNPFDTETIAQERDRLQISFTIGPEKGSVITYGFEYNNGKWQEEAFEPFGWIYQYSEEHREKLRTHYNENRNNIKD